MSWLSGEPHHHRLLHARNDWIWSSEESKGVSLNPSIINTFEAFPLETKMEMWALVPKTLILFLLLFVGNFCIERYTYRNHVFRECPNTNSKVKTLDSISMQTFISYFNHVQWVTIVCFCYLFHWIKCLRMISLVALTIIP